jgi:hypothetical protein
MGNVSHPSRMYWNSAEVQSVGNTYLDWLYHIRHRGTFSSIAPDFERFINTTSAVTMPEDAARTLRSEWLDARTWPWFTRRLTYADISAHTIPGATRGCDCRYRLNDSSVSSYPVLHPRPCTEISTAVLIRSPATC